MENAVYETTSVKVGAGDYVFTLAASKLAFEGFMSVYVNDDEKEENNRLLGKLEKGMVLEVDDLREGQHFTEPPDQYTEASLV